MKKDPKKKTIQPPVMAPRDATDYRPRRAAGRHAPRRDDGNAMGQTIEKPDDDIIDRNVAALKRDIVAKIAERKRARSRE